LITFGDFTAPIVWQHKTKKPQIVIKTIQGLCYVPPNRIELYAAFIFGHVLVTLIFFL